MRVAYADPPYLRQGSRHYKAHHPEAAIWDTVEAHHALITHLTATFPDGWALSASSSSLHALLPQCPPTARIAAWVKPFCAFKRGVRPCYAWEPVIFVGGRNLGHPPPTRGGAQTTPKDYIAQSITLRKGLVGAKPLPVCQWVLNLLGVRPEDTVVDLFPGTGIMAEAVTQRQAVYVVESLPVGV